MTPLQMSAQYAAYVWFRNQETNAGASNEDAHQFARLEWERFLPSAHEGFGRLLMRLTKKRARRKVRVRPTAVVAAVA
ncbi:MAG TPA: hypothetical protein VM533_14505 [Fimbriiglobus sp.]|jgi:hypothetical protein|nr:hypothetical protein [Fimbriiglobus sp.]